ncbi:SLAP domain-containing protein [Companilactobacillus baiquanensis]|uniref:SLAP domain-containing protein n=1 Tax=Companilactobacillus baiquanensis TaxID=2486005 RepID=A0ABW1UR65_9LACO|nr:SLAP domain-containing protein [Companilactobacillus baiquanensis]
MRFQQLNHDPNTVMKKKLVKSNKNWVVVSSLSIAGGLFLFGAPSYVANAATTDTVQQEVVTSDPSSSGTTSAQTTTAAPVTDGSKETPQLNSNNTNVTDTTKDTDATSENTANTADTTNQVTDDTSTTPDPTNNNVENGGTDATNTGNETTQQQPQLQAQAFSAEAAPVAEDEPVSDNTSPRTSGTGWLISEDGKTLEINGQLDTDNPSDYQGWGGTDNLNSITTINVTAAVTAPTDSSYLFANMPKLTSIDMSQLDTSNVASTEGMFKNDISLTNPDFSQNSFKMATNISHMFENDTGLITVKFGGLDKNFNRIGTGFTKIVNGSYAFANCTSLTDILSPNPDNSGTNSWIVNTDSSVPGKRDLRAMFKNDVSLSTINMYTWAWAKSTVSESDRAETGDSSIGEGMFDGTNLSSLTLSSILSFNPKTLLTSNEGTVWSTEDKSVSLYGVPQDNPATGISNGLGDVFKGSSSKEQDGQSVKIVLNATDKLATGTSVVNHVTLHTNKGDIVQDISGKVGDTGTIEIPATYTFADGNPYTRTSTATTASFTFGQTMATALPEATYDSLPATGGTVTINTSDESNTPISITVDPTNHLVGDTVNVDLSDPTITAQLPTGYHISDDSIVQVTFQNSTDEPVVASEDSKITLEGDTITPDPVTVQTNKGPVTLTVPEGEVGTTVKPVTLESKPGYDAPEVSVTYNPDGTATVTNLDGSEITSDNLPTYTGKTVKAGSEVTIVTDQGTDASGNAISAPVSVTIPDDAVIGTPTKVTVSVKGYEPKEVEATISVDEQGNYTATYTDADVATGTTKDPLKLNGENITPDPVTVQTNKGPVTLTVPEGEVGTTVKPVTLESKPGYDAPEVSVTYNPDGTATVTNLDGSEITSDKLPTYTGVPNKAISITFTKPDGSTQVVPILAGSHKYGDDPITITPDSINGYTAPAVLVTFNNEDGTPSLNYANDPTKEVDDQSTLTYTPIPTSSGETDPDTPENGDIEYKNQTISTYADKPAVQLYQLGEDGKMTLSTTRSLASATDWLSDAVITVDGVGYYRVSTNEWAKMSQAYPYTAPNVYVRAYDDSAKLLYKAESDLIENRSLAPNSSWVADHQTYVINNTKHYRVSTNEFVNEKDVYVYTPIDAVVTTHAGSYASLYTAKGDLVTNRSLSANSSWKTDSITNINGEQYYRVSTNEFVKAADVDINR